MKKLRFGSWLKDGARFMLDENNAASMLTKMFTGQTVGELTGIVDEEYENDFFNKAKKVFDPMQKAGTIAALNVAAPGVGSVAGQVSNTTTEMMPEESSEPLNSVSPIQNQSDPMYSQGLYMNGGRLSKKPMGGAVPYNNKPNIQQYDGQTHQGSDEGIPVDNQGNPSAVSKKKPVALTENDEVSWSTPMGTYIFSNEIPYKNGKKEK